MEHCVGRRQICKNPNIQHGSELRIVTLSPELHYDLRSALFWDITQRIVAVTSDVSGQKIGPFFKDQAVQEEIQ